MARKSRGISIDISGVTEIQKQLGNITADLRTDALKEATLAAAQVFATGIKERMPRVTGESAESVSAQVVDAEPGKVVAAAGPDKEHWYIMYKEYGFTDQAGRKHPPQPFMRPTQDEDGEKAIEAGAVVLRRRVEGV